MTETDPFAVTNRFERDLETDSADQSGAQLPERIGRFAVRRLLGCGGFGLVYLAYDDQLGRLVALKVPHAQRVEKPAEAQAYLTEARIVANLDHPHIVPVYDVGGTPEFPCYVVSKYIEGCDLAARMKESRIPLASAAELVATVAEALHYAHTQGFVHRDVKPGNILIDGSGRPFVVDFGLALREQSSDQLYRYAGTPAYMSPEQARGEGHRVDGRSDIFSLGIVLYQLLVGRKPFRGETQSEILEQIATVEPKPPRQMDDQVPRELERICLKALAKRASERYTTARDLADDLRHFLNDFTTSGAGVRFSESETPRLVTGSGPAITLPHSDALISGTRPVRIVPKGLRAYDQHDADFFLELLPGPRDRDGLPASIRFWKSRIEGTDHEKPFSVGLIYGPSGCGKSSLVKAGLIPRLADHVLTVYLEANARETEARLLTSLRRRCPQLADNLNLKETLAALRRGEGIPRGKKTLIVLDQFEQWLHAHPDLENSDLAQALRQCDGAHVQCIVMVRDDFWMAVTRFLSELEIVLVQGENLAAADLFDLRHARRVLTEFGQSLGDLPANTAEISRQQQDFIHQAVQGLSQDGKVNCVRLALFAEMMKGHPWTPASLKMVGGAAGVGVAFLEETFSARTANPRYRFHESAARGVLQALLPEPEADIKGGLRSYSELLQESGYTKRLADFQELIRILDGELRMITPTQPVAGASDAQVSDAGPPAPLPSALAGGCYQLTHDYLVPAIRQWLTRKQRETRRGRTEIKLAERAGLWNARREKNQLPSWLEVLAILAYTQRSKWSATERELMRATRRHYLWRWFCALVLIVVGGLVLREVKGRVTAEALVAQLLRADSGDVAELLHEIEPVGRWAIPRLREARAASSQEVLHRELALLHLAGVAGNPPRIIKMIPRLSPEQAKLVALELRPVFVAWRLPLWDELQAGDTPQEILAIATVLAANDPDDARWADTAAGIVEQVLVLSPDEARSWLTNMVPIGRHLVPELRKMFTRLALEEMEDSQRTYVAALGLERFLHDNPLALVQLLVDHARHPSEFHCLLAPLGGFRDAALVVLGDLRDERLKETAIRESRGDQLSAERGLPLVDRIANAVLAELMLGDSTSLRKQLRSTPNQSVRSVIIHRLALFQIPPATVFAVLEGESQPDVRAALLLALGEYPPRVIPGKLLGRAVPLIQRFRSDRDAETHSAAEWLAARWNLQKTAAVLRPLPSADSDWYVTSAGQTMVKVRGREGPAYDFALSATEITVAQYRLYDKDYERQNADGLRQFLDVKHLDQCAAVFISRHDAMLYCNWLTRKERLDERECCYDELGNGLCLLKPRHLTLKGFRLPEVTEWQYGCQAGTTTEFSFGNGSRLLPNYAWYFSNSRSDGQHRTRAAGTTKPNPYGLFDMYGNAWEWVTDSEDSDLPILCGGSCDNDPVDLRPFERASHLALNQRQLRVGFRIAQTIARPAP